MGELPYRHIMVTGAGGFVGKHLVAGLRERIGPTTRLILADRTPTDDPDSVSFDLLDPDSIDRTIESVKPDLVFHLAGQASVSSASKDEAKTWRANATGSLELALALKAHAPAVALIFASSAEVYGAAFLAGEVSEETPPQPASVYAKSKLLAEQALAAALPEGAPLLIVRPSNHVGPGQDDRFALPSFAGQIARAEAAGEAACIRVGNLSAKRDFMDVRDVADAYISLAGALPGFASRTMVNLSSGRQRSLESMLDALRAMAKVETSAEIDPDRFRASEMPVASLRSDRIRTLIEWSPSRVMDATLADVLDAARCASCG